MYSMTITVSVPDQEDRPTLNDALLAAALDGLRAARLKGDAPAMRTYSERVCRSIALDLCHRGAEVAVERSA